MLRPVYKNKKKSASKLQFFSIMYPRKIIDLVGQKETRFLWQRGREG